MAKKSKAGGYRIQASTEAEVARARLARAQQAADHGDVPKAIDLAVESAFDAGIATSFAALAKETKYKKVAQDIMHDAQAFVRSISASTVEDFDRAANPTTSKQALKFAQSSSLLGAVFYAGGAHGYAMAKNDKTMLAKTIRFYDETYSAARDGLVGQRRAAASNPGLPVGKLKNRLLR